MCSRATRPARRSGTSGTQDARRIAAGARRRASPPSSRPGASVRAGRTGPAAGAPARGARRSRPRRSPGRATRKSALRSMTRLPAGDQRLRVGRGRAVGERQEERGQGRAAASAAGSEPVKTRPRSSPRSAGMTCASGLPAWVREVTAASCARGMAEEDLDQDFARVTGRADDADFHGRETGGVERENRGRRGRLARLRRGFLPAGAAKKARAFWTRADRNERIRESERPGVAGR